VTSHAEYVEFVRARSSALLRTACLLTAGDQQAAEDLVQSALAQAFVAWWRIREPAAREAYVRRILIRAAVRRTRRRAWRAEELVAEVPDDPVGDLSESVDQRLTVWPLLGALPARQRAVLVLRYYEELSEAQIADALGCSPGTVKSHASRALATLRSQLGPASTAADAPTTRPEEP
jgi:RNA polymerase sigma-70 factor (sigma-E family)